MKNAIILVTERATQGCEFERAIGKLSVGSHEGDVAIVLESVTEEGYNQVYEFCKTLGTPIPGKSGDSWRSILLQLAAQ